LVAAFVGNVKITITPQKIDEKFSFETEECMKGGQGYAPLGVPPPLGESGGHSHSFLKFYYNP